VPVREAPARRRHRVYGVELESDFAFTHHLAAGEGPPELTFGHREGRAEGWEGADRVWSSAVPGPEGGPDCVLLRRPGEELLRFEGIADFRLAGDRVDGWVADPGRAWLAELRFLGPVLAYWLELRGVWALHAASVVLPAPDGPRAIGFLSSHGGGKSLLAAELMRRAGAALLADDVTAVEPAGAPAEGGRFLARPASPQMRLAPEDAERLTGRGDLPPVHPAYDKRRVRVGGTDGFGRFHDRSVPLSALYLPERRADGEIEISRLSPADALLALAAHSFVARLVAGAGLQPGRLATLAELAGAVPTYRLTYPTGLRNLEAVVRRLRNG